MANCSESLVAIPRDKFCHAARATGPFKIQRASVQRIRNRNVFRKPVSFFLYMPYRACVNDSTHRFQWDFLKPCILVLDILKTCMWAFDVARMCMWGFGGARISFLRELWPFKLSRFWQLFAP